MSENQPAAAPALTTARAGGRPPVRVHLADLMTWVLGAGIVAAVIREARPAGWFAPVLDVGRILGVVAVILAILTGIGLFHQTVVRLRQRRAERGSAYLVAIAWRLTVLSLLGVALANEARLLGGDVLEPHEWSDPETVRLRLLPLAMTLALAGILAGLVPARDSGQRRQRPRRRAGLAVVGAAGAGLLLATTQAVIPYLVLLAMNAVRNAMQGPAALQILQPNLDARLRRAGLEAAPVLACCLALGLLIARDLRPAASRPAEAGRSRRDLVALLAATAAAGAGAAWLLAVTIPRLDGWLAEGLLAVVDPLNAAIIVLGFAGLALGLAARVPGPPEHSEPDLPVRHPWARAWRVLGNLTIALILLDVIAARAIDLIVARRAIDGGPVDPFWTRWVGWVDATFDWLRSYFPFRLSPWTLFEGPEWLALALLEVWVAWRAASLLVTSTGDEPGPIDACLADRRTIGRFAIRWLALTVLAVASLPASFLAGLAVVHTLIHGSL